jgi:hypothetical protein
MLLTTATHKRNVGKVAAKYQISVWETRIVLLELILPCSLTHSHPIRHRHRQISAPYENHVSVHKRHVKSWTDQYAQTRHNTTSVVECFPNINPGGKTYCNVTAITSLFITCHFFGYGSTTIEPKLYKGNSEGKMSKADINHLTRNTSHIVSVSTANNTIYIYPTDKVVTL